MKLIEFVHNFIPELNSPEKIYELFRGLGYDNILAPSLTSPFNLFTPKVNSFLDKRINKCLFCLTRPSLKKSATVRIL